MPHDANGNELKVGDHVSMSGTVKNILPSENYCNCTVELDLPQLPDNTKTLVSSVNTRQLVLSPVAEPVQEEPDETEGSNA